MLNANDFKKKQIIFLFTNEGDKLSFLNDNIIVKNKEGEIKYQSTCYRLFMICVVGNISITSGLIQRSKKFGFSILHDANLGFNKALFKGYSIKYEKIHK